MKINIDKKFDPVYHEELLDACQFYASQLLPKAILDDIVLDLELNDTIIDLAQCVNEDEGENPRHFTIMLDGIHDDTLSALAHEFVHLKQFAKNELRKELINRDGLFKLITYWMGEEYEPKSDEHPYYDLPWEIEALGREVGLGYKYIQHQNK